MTAILPAQLLYIAAQFVSTDECKAIITAVNIKQKDDVITISSTDGYRAFRVSFEINEKYHMDDEELNLHYSTFKKRIAKAQFVRIDNENATFTGDKCETVIRSIEPVAGDYPNLNAPIWPDTYHNDPNAPIAFNPRFLAEYLTEMNRYSYIPKVKMEVNKPAAPMQFSATIEPFGDEFETQYLLMPVQMRDNK